MKKIIIGIGVPGSGKTTLLKSFASKNNYIYICPDEIRKELSGDESDQSRNKEVWQIAKDRVREASKKNLTCVFDATFAYKKPRREFVFFVREAGYNYVQGVFADTDLDTAKERNNKRHRNVPSEIIESMYSGLDKDQPSLEDGFDALFTFDEFQEITEAQNEIKVKKFGPNIK
jgi:predicted kinase